MKEYTNQELLDICDRMPPEAKGCRVDNETNTVDLGDFIINYGRALIADITTNQSVSSEGRGGNAPESLQNEAGGS